MDDERESDLFQFDASSTPILRYDARGHGRSPAAGEVAQLTWDSLAADMGRVALEAQFRNYVAAGASMGAATALLHARDYPNRVRGLVLAIPPTAWGHRAPMVDKYLANAEFAEENGMDALKEVARDWPLPRIWADEFPDIFEIGWRHKLELGADRYSALMKGAAVCDLPSLDELAAEVTQPTLILAWEGDPQHPVVVADMLADALPGCREEEDFHIAASLEEIRQWPALVEEFLSKLNAEDGGDR